MSLPAASALIGGLAAAGLRDVIVCPGSRSAPLAIAAARCERLRVHSVIDERGAGFFALGLARTTGRPAAVVCTSGTAGAHLYPAVIEAATAGVPLIAITADRPPELQHCMAPQTIDQRDLFGRFARASLTIDGERAAAARVGAQAFAASLGPVPGPVHVNAPARKPLVAGEVDLEISGPRIEAPRLRCAPAALDDLVARLERSKRPLLCTGPAPLDARRWREVAHAAAAAQSMPLLAEATSQLRLCPIADGVPAISWFADRLLDPLPERLRPDLVIQIGVPTSAGLLDLCADPEIERVVLAPHQVTDPSSRAAAIVIGDLAESLAAIASAPAVDRRRWATAWIEDDRRADEPAGFSGQAAVAAVCEALPREAALVVGNSLAVRWLDQAVAAGSVALDVVSQRGASGIDGLIAGAAGVAAAGDRPACLLAGDVSAAHDVGSLAIAAAQRAPLVLVVLDNGGGKIFDELPYARRLRPAERALLVTPTDLCFETAATAWGVRALAVDAAADLVAAVTAASERAGATLIRARLSPTSRRAI